MSATTTIHANVIAEAREWLNDCADCGIWSDMEAGDFDADAEDALSDAEIETTVDRHYDGGILGFVAASMHEAYKRA